MTSNSNSVKDKEKIFPSYTELRIYPSFTEIREKFNAPQNFKMYFAREVYDQIVKGSLNVEGIEVLSQNSVTKANNLENQIVFLRRTREQPIECQVVRANDLLLKDIKTGRFIRAQNHELEYVNIPEEEGQEVTFALKQQGDATLSYLINGIQWSPRYNLKVETDNHSFEAWADMRNNTKRDYQIKHTELFGGDVHLQQSVHQTRRFAPQCCMKSCCCCCDSFGGAAPTIESEGELGGIYWYSIDQPFILIQQSTFSLPFVQPNIKLEKYSGLQNYFQEQTQKGKFQRKYRIESDRFLPKGTVTIREDGRVVGQAHLSDISQGEKQDLDCGNDPDVSFNREVKILSQKRESASYNIRLTIKNSKSKAVKYEYKEIISSAKFTVTPKGDNEQLNNQIQSIGEGLQILGEQLQPNDEQIFQYEISFSIGGVSDTPCISDSSAAIIRRITEGGLAECDQQLKLHDTILRVNQMDLTQTKNEEAVDGLKAGDHFGFRERRVLLRRGANGFGFNIVGNAGDEGIYISFIQADGIADKSGELQKGDRILSVNNIDFRGLTDEDAATVLKTCGDTADFHVIYKYDDFIQIENRIDECLRKMTDEIGDSTGSLKTLTKRQFFVRAKFDYDSSKDPNIPDDRGLSFRAGDILYVTNTADDCWWQAKRITDEQQKEEGLGIIPSKSRVEKKECMNFDEGTSSRSNTLHPDKKEKKKFGLFEKSEDRIDSESDENSDNEEDNVKPVPSYELVTQHEVNYTRPIIIFGPFKELLNDQLLNDQPDKFANCVPHTSRPKRETEVEGREYYFVSSYEQMNRDIQNYLFIEAGEHKGNLYGTSLNAVRQVANSSKHCILDVSGHAIRRLISGGLFPIVIFVKPRGVKWILDNMKEEANEEDAQQIYEKSMKIEQKFGDVFTNVIEDERLSDIYDHINEVIDREQSLDHVWITSNEEL